MDEQIAAADIGGSGARVAFVPPVDPRAASRSQTGFCATAGVPKAAVTASLAPVDGAEDAVIDARTPLRIVITEGIPVHDTAEFWAREAAVPL
jgi:hypothetical protein